MNLLRPGRRVPHEPEPRRHSVGRHPLLWPTVCLGRPLSKAESHLEPRPTGEPPACRRSDCSHVISLSAALLRVCVCVCFHYHVSGRLYVFAEYYRQYARSLRAHVLLQCSSQSRIVCAVHDASVNRVSKLISLPPPASFPPPPLPIPRSCPQPGFDEINPEWKTSLERRKKIKGTLARRAKESRLCC